MTQVFISYSRKDLAFVRNLAADLQGAGLQVWWDLSGTKGGDEWETKITGALKQSQYLIVVLTPDSVESRWVRREYLLADDRGLKIIPLQVIACETPLALHDLQRIDALDGKYPACLPELLNALGIEELNQKLKPKSNSLSISPMIMDTQVGDIQRGIKIPDSLPESLIEQAKSGIEPPIGTFQDPGRGIHPPVSLLIIGSVQFIQIPAGKFIMGSKDDNLLAFDNEKPQHTVELAEYWMAKFPLVNFQFAEFIRSSGYMTTADKDGGWSSKKTGYLKGINWQHPLDPETPLKDMDNYPVVQISWVDAREYCNWFNTKYTEELSKNGLVVHLPTEAQWEKAARGEYGNEWPWGNEFDSMKCNSGEGKKRQTTAVDAYPLGDSPYGCADMVGNVWEWTHTLWNKYPYKVDDGRTHDDASGKLVLRGGSFYLNNKYVRCACRNQKFPGVRSENFGFRMCASPIS